MEKQNGFRIPIWTGLFSHYSHLKEAVWLFLWFIDRTTSEKDGMGIVLGGRPIRDEEAASTFGCSVKSIRRWRRRLTAGGYIAVRRTPVGYVVRVQRSKKWTERPDKGVQSDETRVSTLTARIGQSDCPKREIRLPESGNPIKTLHRQNSTKQETAAVAALDFARESFAARFGQPPTWSGKDRKALAGLLANHPEVGLDEFRKRWGFYMASTDPFFAKRGFSLAYFSANFDALLSGPVHGKPGEVKKSAAQQAQADELQRKTISVEGKKILERFALGSG